MKNILVTGAGALLGQGILRSLQGIGSDFYIHTADPDYRSTGHWLGNKAHIIKFANDPEYLTSVEKILYAEIIDIVLIGTDTELPIFALNKVMLEQKYSLKILVSNSTVIEIANDKYLTANSLKNNGFIVRHSIEVENDGLDYGLLKFFSKETNTIYEPKLELVWDDSSFVTGSLTPVTGSASDDYKVVVTNLKNEYSKDTKIKIRVKGRDMFPYKTFGKKFGYDQAKYLPSGSTYYQIEDYVTNEIIVPFGDYSKLSCDSTSNYFNLDTSTYAADRVYRLKIKILQNGITDIIDDKLTFKIVE